jgi:RNase P subunit RPR2
MKVIKEGQLPKTDQPWWIGATVRCENCGFVGTLDTGDQYRVRSPSGRKSYLLCPTEKCGHNIQIPVQRSNEVICQ